MIKVKVKTGPGKTTIEIEGHANHAPKGQDIVCASVSTIAHVATLGLQAVADEFPEHVEVIYDDNV